jgi:hypothetical protein
MRLLHDTASASPGLSEMALLRACGLPECGLGYRRPAQRATAAGLLVYRRARKGNAWRIYATVQDADLDDLRHELLHGNPGPDRARQIMEEVGKIQAEQAASYAAAQGKD